MKKDYRAILKERIEKIPKGDRPISDHYQDCLEVFEDVLCEAINDAAPSQAVETKADKFYSKCLKCGTPIYGTLEKISGKCDKCIPVAPAPLCEHYRGGTPFEACPFCAPKAPNE